MMKYIGEVDPSTSDCKLNLNKGHSEIDMKEKSNPSHVRKRSLPIPTPCTLLISYLLLLVAFIFIFFRVTENDVPAHEGDTVLVRDFNGRFASRLQVSENPFFGDVSAHNCSIFVVPTSQVNLHTEQKTFQESGEYLSNASWTKGQVPFIYELSSLEYEVSAASENDSTIDGELVVFDDYVGYGEYITGYDYAKHFGVFNQSFPIGAKNQSKTTTIKFSTKQQARKRKYYYVASFVPGKTTFSYKATVVHNYYNPKDYGKERCSVHFGLPYDKECSVDLPINEQFTLLALVHPNSTSSDKTQIRVEAIRLLPPPSVLVFLFVIFVMLPLVTITLYTFKHL